LTFGHSREVAVALLKKVAPRHWGRWLLLIGLLALLAVAARLVSHEVRTSERQARYLAELGRELSFKPGPGPSPLIRFPHSGPYDERLGYSELPAFTQRLTEQDFLITRQARISPRLAALGDKGLPLAYREKTQAGLDLLDCNRQSLYAERFPERSYADFASLPRLLVDALAFIEDRDLLTTRSATHNPAMDWSRFGRALSDQVIHVVDKSHPAPGASTLATQIEKYRHSPGGRTSSPQDKLRQMASASVRVYLDGENTLAARQQIMLDYLNTVPLAAKPGFGEIHGIGDGLWAWYGRDFDEVNQLLDSNSGEAADDPLRRRAEAFKQALSLLIAQRRPSHYLREGAADLAQLTDSHLRALAAAGVIPAALRDAALPVKLNLQQKSESGPPISFVTRKAVTALRGQLSSLLQVGNLYDLDRLDLSASSTLNGDMQSAVTAALRQLKKPADAKAAELYGRNMLSSGDDPSKIIFSFTLFEQRGGANLLRVQTDNFDQPFDINEGARLNLGSTAKLRTLITYLEIIAELHQRYVGLPPKQLAQVPVDKENALSVWALAYLAKAQNRGLPAMLEAAMERRYSGNPGEGFVTGGGVQTFSNFEASENSQMITVREGLQQSVNLVFVRLMRDVVRHYKYKLAGGDTGTDALEPQEGPRRQALLSRFADKEGRNFMVRFYKKYHGKSPEQAQQLLLGKRRPVPARLATVFRSIAPQADLGQFSVFMRQRFDEDELPDAKLATLYAQYGPDKFSLADRGYIAGVHPLELWLLGFLRQQPAATLKQVLDASVDTRQEVYGWLFKTRNKYKQDKRIRQMTEEQAFVEIGRAWRRLGYPFESLTPSYGSALGSSGDRPAALAELMGIVVNKGMRLPLRKLQSLDFAQGTPYETHFENNTLAGERLLPVAITDLVRRSLVDVVENGTARRLKGGLRPANSKPVEVGGKTGTGDHRFETYGPGGRLLSTRIVSRSATFVFLMGDRFFGTMTAYVPEPYAASYKFTSALSVQLLKSLTPTLTPMMAAAASDNLLACRR
jgi:membrane peptidoglycan carboxypeptidase